MVFALLQPLFRLDPSLLSGAKELPNRVHYYFQKEQWPSTWKLPMPQHGRGHVLYAECPIALGQKERGPNDRMPVLWQAS